MFKKIKKAFKWAVPAAKDLSEADLESKINEVIKENKEIRKVFMENPDKEEYFRRNLGYCVLDSYQENKNLRRFASYIDTMDKSLVPADVVADSTKILYGIGFAFSALKEVIEMGPKLAYMAYYTAKTKDLIGTIKDLAYEGLSFFLPGSLLDLTNRYVKKAEKYVLKNAANKFLYNLGFKTAKIETIQPNLNPVLQPT